MPLKRPVTLAQARRWPAAAARRESFCARMGGMRKKLTGDQAAADPGSPINRALAAWDCDQAEGLKREHVSKGIRMKGITPAMVGSKAKAKAAPRKNPAAKPEIMARHSDKEGRAFRLQRRGEKFDVLVNSTGINWYYLEKAVSQDRALAAWEKWTQEPRRNPARSKAQNLAIALEQKRAGHPRKAAEFFRAAAKAKNPVPRLARSEPAYDPMLYVVHRANAEGKPVYDLAKFRKRSDAVQYAKAYAKSYSVPVMVEAKKV